MDCLRIKREEGFTILEVVFAVSILAIGIMGYTTLKSSSRYSRTYSKQLSQSIQLTASQLEDFWIRGFNSPLLADGADYDYATDIGGTLEIKDFSIDSANWTVRENCPSELSKMINFTATWNETSAKPKSLTIHQIQVRP